MTVSQTELKNKSVANYQFLKEMYIDEYFPNFLVDKGVVILIDLCNRLEKKHPKNLLELYELSHDATERFNYLQEDFYNCNCEIETMARECIAKDFLFIANSYGFTDADIEELIENRNW